jgi:hypothetical protein
LNKVFLYLEGLVVALLFLLVIIEAYIVSAPIIIYRGDLEGYVSFSNVYLLVKGYSVKYVIPNNSVGPPGLPTAIIDSSHYEYYTLINTSTPDKTFYTVLMNYFIGRIPVITSILAVYVLLLILRSIYGLVLKTWYLPVVLILLSTMLLPVSFGLLNEYMYIRNSYIVLGRGLRLSIGPNTTVIEAYKPIHVSMYYPLEDIIYTPPILDIVALILSITTTLYYLVVVVRSIRRKYREEQRVVLGEGF